MPLPHTLHRFPLLQDLYVDSPEMERSRLEVMQKTIKKRIPTGNGPEGTWKNAHADWTEICDAITKEHPPSQYLKRAMAEAAPGKQMGTLGGGNHFIEVSGPSP